MVETTRRGLLAAFAVAVVGPSGAVPPTPVIAPVPVLPVADKLPLLLEILNKIRDGRHLIDARIKEFSYFSPARGWEDFVRFSEEILAMTDDRTEVILQGATMLFEDAGLRNAFIDYRKAQGNNWPNAVESSARPEQYPVIRQFGKDNARRRCARQLNMVSFRIFGRFLPSADEEIQGEILHSARQNHENYFQSRNIVTKKMPSYSEMNEAGEEVVWKRFNIEIKNDFKHNLFYQVCHELEKNGAYLTLLGEGEDMFPLKIMREGKRPVVVPAGNHLMVMMPERCEDMRAEMLRQALEGCVHKASIFRA